MDWAWDNRHEEEAPRREPQLTRKSEETNVPCFNQTGFGRSQNLSNQAGPHELGTGDLVSVNVAVTPTASVAVGLKLMLLAGSGLVVSRNTGVDCSGVHKLLFAVANLTVSKPLSS